MPRGLWWSEGGGAFSYERGTAVLRLNGCPTGQPVAPIPVGKVARGKILEAK